MPGDQRGDYRKYLDTNFTMITSSIDSLAEQVGDLNKTLSGVEIHLATLNGTVKDHEEFKQHTQNVIDNRTLNCPNLPLMKECIGLKNQVQKIEEDLLEYKFFKKYPKAIVTLLAVAVIVAIGGIGWVSVNQRKLQIGQESINAKVDMMGIPVNPRGAYQNDSSKEVIDSLKFDYR